MKHRPRTPRRLFREASRGAAEASRRAAFGGRRSWAPGALLLLFVACGDAAVTPPAEDQGAASTAPSWPPFQPAELPRPPLERLEPAARQHIETLLQEAETVLLALPTTDGVEQAKVWGQLGQMYLAYDFQDAAQTCFVRAEERAPQDARWSYYLGVVEQRQGNFENAEAFLRRTLELSPDHPATLARLADMALERHALDDAEQIVRQLIAADAESAIAYYDLGRVAKQRQDPETAIGHFQQTLRLQPQATAVYHALGLAYRDSGRLEKAKETLQKAGPSTVRFDDPWMDATTQWMSGARVHLTQGGRERRAGRLHRAAEHFRLAIQAAPENPKGHHNLGAVLGAQGLHADAVPHLQKALQLDDTLVDAHFDLAMAWHHLGRPDDAITALRRVAELDPGDREARRRLAALQHAQGYSLEARDTLRRLLNDDGQDTAGRLLLAQVEETLGNLPRAAGLFQSVAEAEPNQLTAQLGALRNWMAAGRDAKIRDHLEGVLQEPTLTPKHRRVLQHLLAKFLATSNDDAIRDGSRALRLAQEVFQQERSLAHGETVAMALAAVGRFQDAIDQQQQLLEQARQAGAPANVTQRLERTLASYRRGEAVRAEP